MNEKKRWSIIAGSLLVIFLFLIYIFFESITPLFIALALAYAVSPIVEFMENKGVNRSLTTLVLLCIFFTIGGILLFISIPKIVSDLTIFLGNLPKHISNLLDRLIVFSNKTGIEINIEKNILIGEVKTYLQGITIEEIFPVFQFIQNALTNTISMTVNLLRILVIPVFFFYFLRDFKKINQSIIDIVPKRHIAKFKHYVELYDNVLNGFIRGQIFVAMTLSLLYSIGLSIVGIPFGMLIGIFSGLFNIVPYLGVMFGLTFSISLMIIDFNGWIQFFGVLSVFGIVQAIDGLFVTPKLVGNKVGLTPIQTIFGLMIGGRFAGISGMFLAIPIFGIIKATLKELSIEYKLSGYYLSK